MNNNNMSVISCNNTSHYSYEKKAYSFLELLSYAGIKYSVYGNTQIHWNTMVIDSRECNKGDFFVGLPGTHTHGSVHAREALEKGANVLLIDTSHKNIIEDTIAKASLYDTKKQPSILDTACTIIEVDDTMAAFVGAACQLRRSRKSYTTVIGVTGSAGKTTTKNILKTLLSTAGKTIASHGNLNTVQGMSLCILNETWETVRYAVFECGISARGEMKSLADILDPDIVLITNIGNAHMGGFSDIGELYNEKLTLAYRLDREGSIVVPEEDDTLIEIVRSGQHTIHLHGMMQYGTDIDLSDLGIHGFQLKYKEDTYHFPLLGDVNIRNLFSAMCVVDILNVPHITYLPAIESVQGIHSRYQIISEFPLVIDDSYNANPNAVKAALLWFQSLQRTHNKIVILAGMKELGVRSTQYHQEIIDLCSSLNIETVVLLGDEFVGDNTFDNNNVANRQCITWVESHKDIMNIISPFVSEHTAILVKGSRAYELSTIATQCANLIGAAHA